MNKSNAVAKSLTEAGLKLMFGLFASGQAAMRRIGAGATSPPLSWQNGRSRVCNFPSAVTNRG